MAAVYKIPRSFGFENYQAVQICLAKLSGDEQRIDLLIHLMKNMPQAKQQVGDELFVETLDALKSLLKLSKPRNAIIHGLPVFNMETDRETREVVRHGIYLIQTRQPENSSQRYENLIELCDSFIQEIKKVRRVLNRVSIGMTSAELLRLVNEFTDPDD